MGNEVVEIKLGQQWYFYEYSNSFIVFKIEQIRHQYYDGDVEHEETNIHMRSQGNTVIVRGPFDFTQDKCKLISNVTAHVPVDIKVIPVQVKTRLEKIDED